MAKLALPSFLEEAGPSGEFASELPVKRDEARDSRSFILSEALPVVPARLVKRIEQAEFVDLAEFLKDNMEVERRWAAQESTSGTDKKFRTFSAGSIATASTPPSCVSDTQVKSGKCGPTWPS